MSKLNNKVISSIPTWVSRLYIVCAILLVPWTIYLAYSLPRKHVERHWDVAWVGLDIAIILLLFLTGLLATLRSKAIIISLSATASFLIVDAWFDITSSKPGAEMIQSIILAAFIEIPLAILGFYLAKKLINNM